ncbi:MAG TPA: RHS repeat-associated core domain-containing protein [Chloroflexia bacterium]|nr:RHS repeat-associated core domain-containing protein [Chloroflexia bacterium]
MANVFATAGVPPLRPPGQRQHHYQPEWGSGVQQFHPWGKVRSGGISVTDLNYTGQRKDDTGLLYYHARYYDPSLARFVSPDSIVPSSGAALQLLPGPGAEGPVVSVCYQR